MRINYISSDILINMIYDEFNLKSDDWVGRVPNWIYQALKYYKNNKCYITESVESTFTDNMIILPQYAGEIRLLTVNDKILICNDVSTEFYTIINTTQQSTDKYSIEDQIISLETNNGTYKLWYKTLPVEFNEKFQIFTPKVPDKQYVLENIKWFIFKNILSRGLIHPIYSLGARDPEYDPNKKWQQTINKAKNQLSEMDVYDRNEIANVNMQFITRPSYTTTRVSDTFKLDKDVI